MKTVILVLSLGLLGAALGCEEDLSKRPIETIKATDLYALYDMNEVDADNRLAGKLVYVDGNVASIDKDFLDEITIKLIGKAGSDFETVDLKLLSNAQQARRAGKLYKGQWVVITCPTFTKVMGSPFGTDCDL